MKKDCEMIKDLIPLYVDDVCSEESKQLVEAHIASCEECAKYMAQMKENVTLPMDTNGSDVKGLKKYINKKIWKRAIIMILAFLVVWFVANWAITLTWSEIWPKADEEAITDCLEIVEMDGALYLHQQDLFGFGEIVDVSSMEDYEAGVTKFYLGEQGLTSLDPTGMLRMWIMREKYTRISDSDAEVQTKKIVYCHKNGTEVATLWEAN